MIFERIRGMAEKGDSGLVKLIRMGGIALLKETWPITMNNVR